MFSFSIKACFRSDNSIVLIRVISGQS